MRLNPAPNALLNLAIVLTGKTLGLSRSEVQSAIKRAGGYVQDAIDAPSTSMLVAVDITRPTTKMQDANKHRIPIASDSIFKDMIEGRIDARRWMAQQGGAFAQSSSAPAASAPVAKKKPKAKPKIDLVKSLAKVIGDDPFGAAF